MAVLSGWHLTERSLAEELALVHSEISEALEEWRSWHEPSEVYYVGGSDKPEGIPIELADAVIRIADICGAHGIDLGEAVVSKMRYNATRPHRHGGKRA